VARLRGSSLIQRTCALQLLFVAANQAVRAHLAGERAGQSGQDQRARRRLVLLSKQRILSCLMRADIWIPHPLHLQVVDAIEGRNRRREGALRLISAWLWSTRVALSSSSSSSSSSTRCFLLSSVNVGFKSPFSPPASAAPEATHASAAEKIDREERSRSHSKLLIGTPTLIPAAEMRAGELDTPSRCVAFFKVLLSTSPRGGTRFRRCRRRRWELRAAGGHRGLDVCRNRTISS